MDFHDERTCAERMERICGLNDKFRVTGLGGKLFITRAVAALEPQVVAAVIKAVREFDDFTPANDPYGEHDLGSVNVAGRIFWFRLAVYDENMEFGSPDPADETISRRVLTIMTSADL